MVNNNIIEHLYDKEVTCPVCNFKFTVKAVKINSPRVSSRDSDFFIRYSVINPYLYDVWICNSCGYAAMKTDFPKVKSYQKDLVLKNITRKWKPKEYPIVIDEEHAIERYRLALLSSITMEKPASSNAMILLKTAWMYRLLEETDKEKSLLSQALSAFIDAYTNENFPIYGLQRDSITYLIGELYRLTGDNENALQWYSKVITTIGASHKVKDLARTSKDIIKNCY